MTDSMDGALLVDKPTGMTSHDVVDRLRRHFGIKKVGHCGTLDPSATGLLIIVLGRGTKLSELLMASDKVYGRDHEVR
jgi:tRNA pseudouridine55 synthase